MCIMADQQFCLRWNNHQSTLVSVFDTLLEKNILVDCTLAAEGQYLKAHKVVLCACSPYLEALLSEHYEKHPIVILKDVKYQELKSMLDYMYKGEVNISQDQLGTFLKAAESLQIKGLTDGNGEDPRDIITKRHEQPRKAQQPPRSPAVLPQSSALSADTSRRPSQDLPSVSPLRSREGSLSPTARKRRRPRRPSQSEDYDQYDDNHTQSTPSVPNNSQIQSTPAIIPKVQPPDPDDIDDQSRISDSGLIKEQMPSELIEPKSEYIEEQNNDDIDLTLDDDDDMDGMDMDPGTSHGDSNQSYEWPPMGDRPEDMYSQDSMGTVRDNQEIKKEPSAARKHARSIMPIIMGIQSVRGSAKFACPNNCGRLYKHKCSMLQHFRNECGKERQFMCNICYRLFNRKSHLKTHLGLVHQVVVTNV